MKEVFLKFPQRRISYLPKYSSRRFGGTAAHFRSMAFKEDGDPDPVEEAKLALQKINGLIKTELDTRGYENKVGITAIINEVLKDVKIEALRNFDAAAIETSVRNVAAEVQKIKDRPTGATEKRDTGVVFQELIEKNWEAIEKAFTSRNAANVVTLNLRAAVAPMTVGNAVDDSVVPPELVESFSVDSFIKKRRPYEYIFDIVDRRTLPEITEYKTWMEEGDEQGAFANVSEGAVKPLVSKTIVRNTAHYKKIAGKYVVTEELTKFRKEAWSILQTLFNDQLVRNYCALLVVDLLAAAAAYVGTALDGQYANPTDYHAIGAVAAQIESLDFFPDILIINPQDKWRIGLEQNTQGSFFVNIPTYSPDGTVTMMGFPVISSNRVAVGNFILGEAKLFKVEDEPVQIRMGYGINVTKDVNGFVTDVTSDIDTNRMRVIVETFYRDYIGTNYAGSFVYANFATVKAALHS